MGRYLAAGIPATVQVLTVNKNYYDIMKDKDEILKKIGETIDVSKYDVEDYDNGFVLSIKSKYIEENIHEVLKEFHKLKYCLDDFLFDMNLTINPSNADQEMSWHRKLIKLEDFTKEKYPITIQETDTGKVINGLEEDCPFYHAFNHILLDKNFEISNIEISIGFINIWRDWNKYVGEDETPMLDLLIKFSRNYFKSELGKNLLFYISG